MLDFLLVTAIIFIVGPLLVIEAFAIWIFLAFSRADKLATSVTRMAGWWILAGIIILIIYFILRAFS